MMSEENNVQWTGEAYGLTGADYELDVMAKTSLTRHASGRWAMTVEQIHDEVEPEDPNNPLHIHWFVVCAAMTFESGIAELLNRATQAAMDLTLVQSALADPMIEAIQWLEAQPRAYELIRHTNPALLEAMVDERLNSGWDLAGSGYGFIDHSAGHVEAVYCQPVSFSVR